MVYSLIAIRFSSLLVVSDRRHTQVSVAIRPCKSERVLRKPQSTTFTLTHERVFAPIRSSFDKAQDERKWWIKVSWLP